MLVQAGNAVIPCALQQALDLPHDESLVHLWPQNTSTNAKGRSSSQDFRVVDAIQSKQHGLQPVDALLLLEFSTGLALRAPAVHWEQASQSDVPVYADGIHVGVAFGLPQGGRHPGPGKAEEQAKGQLGPPPAPAALPRHLGNP